MRGAVSTPSGKKDVTVTISNGAQVLISKPVTAMLPAGYVMSEPFDIGSDQGSSVTPDYPANSSFPGKIGRIPFNVR